MLAGLYKAPTKYAPHINLPAARARANEVLTNMVQAGFMTEGQVIGARRKPASIVERSDDRRPELFPRLGLRGDQADRRRSSRPAPSSPRRRSISTCSARPRKSIASHLRQYGKEYNVSEAAMVVIDHEGAVRAMVGGLDYGVSQFNRATSSLRQPGSSFKPYVYASAIENTAMTRNTRVVDGAGQHGQMVAEELRRRLSPAR